MKKVLILINSVVYNRGSEALIRGISKICKNIDSKEVEITLVSNEVNFGSWVNIENIDLYRKRKNKNIIEKYLLKIFRKLKILNVCGYLLGKDLKEDIKDKDLIIVIGADNFDKTYNMQETLMYLNTYLRKNTSAKMLLYDCSFNETDITPILLKTLNNFDVMTVRETISEKTIKDNYKGNLEIALYPDPAFVMDKEEVVLPNIFNNKNVVGINVSNLITKADYGSDSSKVLAAYKKMMNYILDETDNNILLVPHVMNNADLSTLRVLYSGYENNERVYLIEDESLNAKQLKYIISNCSLYIGARTHSTIAAYSTCVPTLVLGYSVKSKGIAKDIFGTYENYVLPVNNLDSEDYLLNGFKWLNENKDIIKQQLLNKMPEYIEKSASTGNIIKKYLGE